MGIMAANVGGFSLSGSLLIPIYVCCLWKAAMIEVQCFPTKSFNKCYLVYKEHLTLYYACTMLFNVNVTLVNMSEMEEI